MYEDLVLKFMQASPEGLGEVELRYSCWGCIFCVNGNHFVAVVNVAARSGGSDFVFYDGMVERGRVQPVGKSFVDYAKQKNYLLSLLIYVQRV